MRGGHSAPSIGRSAQRSGSGGTGRELGWVLCLEPAPPCNAAWPGAQPLGAHGAAAGSTSQPSQARQSQGQQATSCQADPARIQVASLQALPAPLSPWGAAGSGSCLSRERPARARGWHYSSGRSLGGHRKQGIILWHSLPWEAAIPAGAASTRGRLHSQKRQWPSKPPALGRGAGAVPGGKLSRRAATPAPSSAPGEPQAPSSGATAAGKELSGEAIGMKKNPFPAARAVLLNILQNVLMQLPFPGGI